MKLNPTAVFTSESRDKKIQRETVKYENERFYKTQKQFVQPRAPILVQMQPKVTKTISRDISPEKPQLCSKGLSVERKLIQHLKSSFIDTSNLDEENLKLLDETLLRTLRTTGNLTERQSDFH